jgi:hypothetical protein
MRARLARLVPYLPWVSLCTGIGGALIMNRTPGRAWLVVAASVVGWATLFAVNVVERRLRAKADDVRSKRARFALMFGSQYATQTALFFPLPFYVNAASLTVGHGAFFTVYAAVVVVALWDPLYAKAMARTWAAFAVHAFSFFIGLNMVLPVLGVSNAIALWVAGAVTAVGVPVLVLATVPREKRALRWLVVPAALCVVAIARLAAPLVPPAPLELTAVGIGSQIENRELVDKSPTHARDTDLVCHSAVKAPLGLKDKLVHTWRRSQGPQDDDAKSERLDDVNLDVSGGGREAGFRTWSKKRPPPNGWRPGKYTCRVQTATGQVLGYATTTID